MKPGFVTRVRPRMGTLLAVTLRAEAPGVEPPAMGRAFEIARECEDVMSAELSTSDLSRLNRCADHRAGIHSRALAHVLRAARRLAGATEGAFDPTIDALLSLWRDAARADAWPSAAAVARARVRVDWRAIAVEGTRVALRCPGVRLNLGAFGKGVALDRIACALARRGVSGMLNFGESSLRSVGPPPPEGWTIVLRHPRSGLAGQFVLRHGACSTSATYGQHLRIGHRRVGHVLDPRRGLPVRANAQVTVLAASAAVAEAASTALLVLGPSAMERIARRLSVAVCWIDGSGVRTTPGFTVRAAA